MANFWVNGIVSHSDGQPKIQLSNENGIFAQLSMGEARAIANNIMLMCARTEADALLLAFCRKMEFPEQTGAVMMQKFRDFRAAIDDEVVETGYDKGPEEKG
jgi:hypothetical protein